MVLEDVHGWSDTVSLDEEEVRELINRLYYNNILQGHDR